KVCTRQELELIRDLGVEYNVLAITDEIYEHILYASAEHISIASLDGMRDRTITINSLSKRYSVHGRRARAFAGGGCGRFESSPGLLPRIGRPLPHAARSSHSRVGASRVPLLS